MPSVTDIQQQSSKVSSNNNNGKLTPPPQQQQISSITSGSTTDPTNADPIIQATLLLEKKQRNLSKRKEKLEGYEQEAKSGKELNKDQKEALSKYAEVLGQIECVKDISEQLKKIQTDLAKNQKRLAKQAAEEKRSLITQRMREYAQIRYLLDHRPTSLKEDESSLLDELSRLIIPSDSSLNTINRSVDTVLSIYQGGPSSSTIKNLTGRTSQEIRQIFEELIQQFQTNDLSNNQQIQTNELIKQTPIVPQVPPTTPASVLTQRELNQQQSNNNNNNNNDVIFPTLTSHTHLVQTNRNEYPLQFDTRNQNIPLQQIIQDNTFFPVDITNTNTNNNQQDLINNPTNDQKQFLQTFNQHLTGQSSAQTVTESQSSSSQQQQQQQGINNYDQENSSNVGNSTNILTDEQQREDEWQHRRTNSGNAHRSQQYNGSANRNSYRGAYNTNNYNNQQHWRGSRGAAGGQRPYHENANRGGNGVYPNYRGNRGGSYRGANRGGNGNGYQKSSQYQQSNEQYQQQQ